MILIPLTGGPFESKIRCLRSRVLDDEAFRPLAADASVVSARAKTFVNLRFSLSDPGFVFPVHAEVPRSECTMTANLRNLTKEKREVPMKRDLRNFVPCFALLLMAAAAAPQSGARHSDASPMTGQPWSARLDCPASAA